MSGSATDAVAARSGAVLSLSTGDSPLSTGGASDGCTGSVVSGTAASVAVATRTAAIKDSGRFSLFNDVPKGTACFATASVSGSKAMISPLIPIADAPLSAKAVVGKMLSSMAKDNAIAKSRLSGLCVVVFMII
ncbi:MAG: hypothetical protein VB106_07285 [Clostridiaceae bacterium]|nr:hypothetical protein [Clostridiaceae bacterium]